MSFIVRFWHIAWLELYAGMWLSVLTRICIRHRVRSRIRKSESPNLASSSSLHSELVLWSLELASLSLVALSSPQPYDDECDSTLSLVASKLALSCDHGCDDGRVATTEAPTPIEVKYRSASRRWAQRVCWPHKAPQIPSKITHIKHNSSQFRISKANLPQIISFSHSTKRKVFSLRVLTLDSMNLRDDVKALKESSFSFKFVSQQSRLTASFFFVILRRFHPSSMVEESFLFYWNMLA